METDLTSEAERQHAALVKKIAGELALDWRLLYLEHQGEPPDNEWQKKKAEIAFQYAESLTGHSSREALDRERAFEEACSRVDL